MITQDLAYFGEDGKAVFMPEPDQPAEKVSNTILNTPIADQFPSRELRSSVQTEAGSLMSRYPEPTRHLVKYKNTDSRKLIERDSVCWLALL